MTQQPQTYPKPAWLENARFYEVYPQSFADSNGDGIGDIPGITGKLDYIAALGCNALWINPCFDSPFKDAGYDVRDYTQVAPRYGTNDDLIALFEAAHRRGMHVLLDLVPGHTSEEHPWFQASSRPNPAERTIVASSDGPSRKENTGDPPTAPSEEGAVGEADWGRDQPTNVSNRYIWTDSWIAGGDGLPFIGGETERDGTYILNFFKCQPALNYGFAHPHQAWQKPALGPDALATCDAMIDVMRFWLARGADGFRVDTSPHRHESGPPQQNRGPPVERALPRCHHAAQPRRTGRGRRAADALPSVVRRARIACRPPNSPTILQSLSI